MTDYKPLIGRWNHRRGRTKLSACDVLAMRRAEREAGQLTSRRASGGLRQALATRYRVGLTTVDDILTRRSWTRLPPEPVYWHSPAPSVFCSWWLTIWIFLSLCQRVPRVSLMPEASHR